MENSQAEIARLKQQRLDTVDWYEQRFRALRKWLLEEVAPLSKEAADHYFAIVANGKPTPTSVSDWSAELRATKMKLAACEANAARGALPREELLALFKIEVHDKAEEVNPNDEHDWLSLTLGWAVAKGLSTDAAADFALYVRYHTDLG
jgi:hypothetical protein